MIRLLVVALALAAMPPQTGTLRVTVKDPSGAVIPGATVRVEGPTMPQPAVVSSDAQGVATATALPAGRYSVTVEFPGFEARTLTDVRVRTGDNHREAVLAIEKVAQTVS